jgi:crossover junction endodeoxyribonuclease RuvC
VSIVAGIDPGLSGAIALVDAQRVLSVQDMPTYVIAVGRKQRQELDQGSLSELLTGGAIAHVMIERVAARPGQGVTSMFRFGYCAGAVAGMVSALRLPYSFVLPIVWQRAAGCGASGDAARQRAAQLYPAISCELTRKRDGGRADAILIARYGLKFLNAGRGVHTLTEAAAAD